ncbi:MAG: hypothetical protein IJT03_00805 [Clostridia bacterium]|nr:hypothetical protein [Clostridia bacterium]
MKDRIKRCMETLKADKRLAAIVAVGIAAVLLLTFSEIFPASSGNKKEEKEQTASAPDYSGYEEKTEERLMDLISAIDGAGGVRVMVTLESGSENVYAVEQSGDSSSSSESYDKKYVIVEKDGTDSGLMLKVVEPQIRGVAVLCTGADSAEVRSEIIDTVTAVLGVSSNRVSIAKMKTSTED